MNIEKSPVIHPEWRSMMSALHDREGMKKEDFVCLFHPEMEKTLEEMKKMLDGVAKQFTEMRIWQAKFMGMLIAGQAFLMVILKHFKLI